MSVHLNQNLDSLVFKAVLKDPTGGECFEGRAEINLEEEYIDFKGEFVPLYPLGTPMEIYRLYGKREIHQFCGQVYLSDTNLMRLIKVTDHPMPQALDVRCTNIAIPAQIVSTHTVTIPSGGIFRKKKTETEVLPASLTAMTQAQVEILVERAEPFAEGEQLQLTVEEPALFTNTTITIRKVFTYGDASSYLCAIGDESNTQLDLRNSFLKENQVKPVQYFSNTNE